MRCFSERCQQVEGAVGRIALRPHSLRHYRVSAGNTPLASFALQHTPPPLACRSGALSWLPPLLGFASWESACLPAWAHNTIIIHCVCWLRLPANVSATATTPSSGLYQIHALCRPISRLPWRRFLVLGEISCRLARVSPGFCFPGGGHDVAVIGQGAPILSMTMMPFFW